MTDAAEISHLMSLVQAHDRLKAESVSLVPTENLLSPLARSVLASDLVNRYYLLDNTVWEYPQTDLIGEITDIAVSALRRLYNVEHANVRPLSGLNCMTTVLATLTSPGDCIYSLAPSAGGHGATSIVARRLGLRSLHLPFDTDTLGFDLGECERVFYTDRPVLIYIDHSNMLAPLDLDELLGITPPRTFVYYDCSHIMGLMADPDYFDPRRYGLTLFGGSMHKTFPGPQKAALFTDDGELAARLQAFTDSFVSSHHVNSVAALGVAALEMCMYGVEYSRQVRRNARVLGESMLTDGLAVQTLDGVTTRSHQVWVDAPPMYENPSVAVKLLKDARIVVNCARIPSLGGRKGLRFGSTEVTRLGMREDEMRIIGGWVADLLLGRRVGREVCQEVRELRQAFSSPQYCFSELDEMQYHTGVVGSIQDALPEEP